MMLSLLEVLASNALSKDLNITEEFRVEKAVEAFLKGRNTGISIRRKQVCVHPRGLLRVQKFPRHTMKRFLRYHMDMTLCNNERQ